ncbi:LysR family transcriptional regulator [Rhodoplanes sp. SY1]|uniref:LysR family transcriptional regulator n=1 Tax=Rhodoplanes sp. SY1 TaxID=3166646 RepID=UPI0038B586F9
MLNLVHVRSFLAVIERGGVRAAARGLALSPSTVLAHLDLLEVDLAAPLVDRARGRVAPTAQGLAFLPLARALITTAEEALRLVRSAPLRIAAASNVGVYLLNVMLAEFQRAESARPAEAAPAVDLWIGPNPEVAERLVRGRADVALMEWWDDRPGFRAETWRHEPLVVIVPPSHPWASRAAVTVDDLGTVRLLGGEPGTGTGTLLRAALGPAADRLATTGGFGSTEAVKRAVRAGLGVSIVLASAVADEVAAGHLVALPVADATLVKALRLVVPEALPPTAAAARFAAHAIHGATIGAEHRAPA